MLTQLSSAERNTATAIPSDMQILVKMYSTLHGSLGILSFRRVVPKISEKFRDHHNTGEVGKVCDFDKYLAISHKRYNIGTELL